MIQLPVCACLSVDHGFIYISRRWQTNASTKSCPKVVIRKFSTYASICLTIILHFIIVTNFVLVLCQILIFGQKKSMCERLITVVQMNPNKIGPFYSFSKSTWNVRLYLINRTPTMLICNTIWSWKRFIMYFITFIFFSTVNVLSVLLALIAASESVNLWVIQCVIDQLYVDRLIYYRAKLAISCNRHGKYKLKVSEWPDTLESDRPMMFQWSRHYFGTYPDLYYIF